MIRHTVLLSFDGVDDAVISTIVSEVSRLPSLIPEIAGYTVSRDLGLQDGNADLVIVGDFATPDNYRTYAAHPEHLRVLDDHIRPNLTGLSRAQIEIA